MYNNDLIFSYLFLAVLISMICGIISREITRRRGLPSGFWWGFFLWVIGIIVVAIMPGSGHETDSRPRVYYCRNCDKVFSGTRLIVCSHCKLPLFETRILRDDWRSFSPEKKAELRKAFAKGQAVPGDPEPARSTLDAGELTKLKELLDAGVITQEDFDAKKKQLLGL